MGFSVKVFDSESYCGYKQQTTFYEDFGIAEHFGKDAIVDTFNRSLDMWKRNTEYLTELVMVLNWKIWEHHETKPEFAEIYNILWSTADEYAQKHLKGKDLSYYYRTTD